MTAQLPNPAPVVSTPIVDGAGRPGQIMGLWISSLDAAFRALAGVSSATNKAGAPMLGSLVNAASDAAASAAGVPVGGLYRNGNAVQIRLA